MIQLSATLASIITAAVKEGGKPEILSSPNFVDKTIRDTAMRGEKTLWLMIPVHCEVSTIKEELVCAGYTVHTQGSDERFTMLKVSWQ
jgi:hypothetical protein